MSTSSSEQPLAGGDDRYRGAQRDLIIRGSGFLSVLGAGASLALSPFFPPTAQIGAFGWLLVIPSSLLAIGLGVAEMRLRRRPSMAAIHASSFTGIAQVALLQWLAGGGHAPYIQLLMLPMLGAGMGQPLSRCAQVVTAGTLAALTPALYGSVDVAATLTEFVLLSAMSLMTAWVVGGTREHRARLEAAGEQANVLAHVDQLTGMPNRRAFDETLAVEIAGAERDGRTISLVLCDVDHFKQINDTFGHAAGDEVLQGIAAAMLGAVRGPDTAFRWAGDEFAVILRDSGEDGALQVAARLRKAVRRNVRRPDGTGVSLGTGVAELKPGMSAEQVLVDADRALFCHKTRRGHLRGAAA